MVILSVRRDADERIICGDNMKFVEQFILEHKKYLCSCILGCVKYDGKQVREICGELPSNKTCQEEKLVSYITGVAFPDICDVYTALDKIPDTALIRCRETRLDYAKEYKMLLESGHDILVGYNLFGKMSYCGAKARLLNKSGIRYHQFLKTPDDKQAFDGLMKPLRLKSDWTLTELDKIMGG